MSKAIIKKMLAYQKNLQLFVNNIRAKMEPGLNAIKGFHRTMSYNIKYI